MRKRRRRMEYHNPVLLHPSVDALVTNPSGTYVDVTFGGGGHSRAILEKLSPEGRLVAFDQDEESQANLIDDPRFQFVPSNFKNLPRFLQYHKAWPVDGILADLGISSHQIDTAERGFSYSKEGRLDMRMNAAAALSAHEVVNQYDEAQLARLFYTYGELHEGRRLAQQIVRARAEQPIDTTLQLAEALKPSLPRGRENKYLSKIFQALRIEVNHEMEVLESLLTQLPAALKTGGRVAIIAYHSLEDRMVKNFLRAGNLAGEVEKDFFGNPLTPFKAVTRKAVVPDEDEIMTNPRARSAKLRVAEKINVQPNGLDH
ncbi:MAG: 16S rRNA (cytosine(1402)-N(4))-methyltransferase RsmH [Bacteroidales bacterium]|nr:16S rRNA (cytosine(1402)-N(4))-methyltransferase RsmH [Bacteroidales bacterium]